MEFLDLAKKRCSVRQFKNEPLTDEQVAKIIKAGYVAPTACNNQPVKITVIKSADAMAKLSKCTRYTFSAPVVFMICADRDLCWKRSFDGKPSSDVDAAIVTSHMMLEAADLGLGTTWVMCFDADALRREFSLSDNLEPVALLPAGFPAEGCVPSPMHTKYRKYEDMIEVL